MKRLTVFICVALCSSLFTNTYGHFKPVSTVHALTPLTPRITPPTMDINTAVTKIASMKIIATMKLLSSHPDLLCYLPAELVVKLLTDIVCNPNLFNSIPHQVLSGFMSALQINPNLILSIPPNIFQTINNTILSVSSLSPPPVPALPSPIVPPLTPPVVPSVPSIPALPVVSPPLPPAVIPSAILPPIPVAPAVSPPLPPAVIPSAIPPPIPVAPAVSPPLPPAVIPSAIPPPIPVAPAVSPPLPPAVIPPVVPSVPEVFPSSPLIPITGLPGIPCPPSLSSILAKKNVIPKLTQFIKNILPYKQEIIKTISNKKPLNYPNPSITIRVPLPPKIICPPTQLPPVPNPTNPEIIPIPITPPKEIVPCKDEEETPETDITLVTSKTIEAIIKCLHKLGQHDIHFPQLSDEQPLEIEKKEKPVITVTPNDTKNIFLLLPAKTTVHNPVPPFSVGSTKPNTFYEHNNVDKTHEKLLNLKKKLNLNTGHFQPIPKNPFHSSSLDQYI